MANDKYDFDDSVRLAYALNSLLSLKSFNFVSNDIYLWLTI